MTCPFCGVNDLDTENPQLLRCRLCGAEFHTTEAAVQDEPDDPEELDFYGEA